MNLRRILGATTLIFFAGSLLFAEGVPATQPPQADSSLIDAHGTAHVTRVVPIPSTISPEAQQSLARQVPDVPGHRPLADRRSQTDAWQARAGEQWRSLYPVHMAMQTLAGVPVRVVTPLVIPANKQDRVFLNVHGGGFNSDSGSLTETIPIANMTQTKVIAVLYRLAPEHPFPAAIDDTVSVYKELLKNYAPQNIALYGTSAGAVLTAEVTVRLRQLGLPLPGRSWNFFWVWRFQPAWGFTVSVRITGSVWTS